jgi:hypothetical protein
MRIYLQLLLNKHFAAYPSALCGSQQFFDHIFAFVNDRTPTFARIICIQPTLVQKNIILIFERPTKKTAQT